MKRVLAVTMTGALAAVGVWASGVQASGGAHSSATTVRVTLNEFKLLPSTRSARSGTVTFVARNTGKIKHELVVIKTSRAAGRLPVKGGQASEAGAVGEIGPFAGGRTKSMRLRLGRGHYALICNITGHYKAGQFADFNVS